MFLLPSKDKGQEEETGYLQLKLYDNEFVVKDVIILDENLDQKDELLYQKKTEVGAEAAEGQFVWILLHRKNHYHKGLIGSISAHIRMKLILIQAAHCPTTYLLTSTCFH